MHEAGGVHRGKAGGDRAADREYTIGIEATAAEQPERLAEVVVTFLHELT